jgi:PAS domain S-box-containing protein
MGQVQRSGRTRRPATRIRPDDYPLFDLIPAPAYIFDDETLKFLAVNAAAIGRYGYSPAEFAAMSLLDLGPSEDRALFRARWAESVGWPKYAGGFRHVTRSGHVVAVEVVSQRIVYRGRSAHFVVVTDVTERNRARSGAEARHRDALNLVRRMSARARARREADRTRVARELHDQLGQALAAVKIDLCWLAEHLATPIPSRQVMRQKIGMMTGLVDETIVRVRRISSDLRPAILDKLGLLAAIEWHLEAFERQSGIRTKLTSSVEHIDIDVGRATAVFRIVQEAMSNVAAHARATRVSIAVTQDGQQLRLTVTDNGTGVAPGQALSCGSLGLRGMHERAELLDGTVDVRPHRPRGTIVSITIPLGERRQLARNERE